MWPSSCTSSAGSRNRAAKAPSPAAAVIQTSTSSGELRVSSAPTPTLATMKAAEPMPRGQPKLKPSRRARFSTMTSVSGAIVEKAEEAANQSTTHPANPNGRAISA